MQRSDGQSLTEYGIAAALIAIVAISGLTRLGGNLGKLFNGMLPGPGQQTAAVTANQLPAAGSTFVPSSSANASSSPTASAAILLSAPLTTKALSASVQTAGVNGTTSMLSDSLLLKANQLKADGKIDENTYNDIVALANQGHKLAQIETAIDSAAKSAGSNGGLGFDKTSVVLNGKTYSGPDIVAQISGTSPDILAFQQLQSQVLNSSAITDPAAKSLISQLSGNILNVASAAATSGDWIDQDGGGINTHDSYLDDLPELVSDYARQTKGNANGICSTQNQSSACMQ